MMDELLSDAKEPLENRHVFIGALGAVAGYMFSQRMGFQPMTTAGSILASHYMAHAASNAMFGEQIETPRGRLF